MPPAYVRASMEQPDGPVSEGSGASVHDARLRRAVTAIPLEGRKHGYCRQEDEKKASAGCDHSCDRVLQGPQEKEKAHEKQDAGDMEEKGNRLDDCRDVPCLETVYVEVERLPVSSPTYRMGSRTTTASGEALEMRRQDRTQGPRTRGR